MSQPDIINKSLFEIVNHYHRWINDNGENILHFSAFYNRIDICQALIKNNFDINQLTKNNNNALHYSSTNDNPIISMLLIKNEIKFLQKNIFGEIPAHYTANCELAWYYDQLFKREKINILDLADINGNSLAHSAKMYQNRAVYSYWLDKYPKLKLMKNDLGLYPQDVHFFKKNDFFK